MTEETWITFPEAVQLVRDRIGASIGRAEALVRAARKSGEVRPEPEREPVYWLGADDGLLDSRGREFAAVKAAYLASRKFSKDDLLDWLNQHVAIATPSQGAATEQPREGPKTNRAKRAASAIWGTAGPPGHLPRKVICTEIRDRLRTDEGCDPDMDDKTIWRAIKKA